MIFRVKYDPGIDQSNHQSEPAWVVQKYDSVGASMISEKRYKKVRIRRPVVTVGEYFQCMATQVTEMEDGEVVLEF